MKKFLSLAICIAMMLTLVPQVIFAAENEKASTASLRFVVTTDDDNNGTIEPRDSRWHKEDVVEKEHESFTFYNKSPISKATKMVNGHYKKVAHYRVYNDGSGKRQHTGDTYYYTWTGYYRYHITGTSSSWITDTNYVNISEIYQDRGPTAMLFGYLV